MSRAILGGNSPAWLTLTAPEFAGVPSDSVKHADPSPERIAARAKALAARRVEREARQEAERRANAAAAAERKAETKRLRNELSERRKEEHARRVQAERDARPKMSREEKNTRIKAGLARAREEGRLPAPKPKAPRVRHDQRPPSPSRIAPAGRVSLTEAARQVGLTVSALSQAVGRGGLVCVRQSKYIYVRMDEVRAYMLASAEHRRESCARNRAAVRTRKAKSAREKVSATPYPKLVKRGRRSAA